MVAYENQTDESDRPLPPHPLHLVTWCSMLQTAYPEVDRLLEELCLEVQSLLGSRLAGVYLYGSLVCGDFDLEISDIDLLAVTATGITEDEFAGLDRAHRRLVEHHPAWDNRIEIAYVPAEALRTFKTQRGPIAVISPGEPFHFKDAGSDWLINWYSVREKGVALLGEDPTSIIAPISRQEFIQAVRRQALGWREWVGHTRDSRPSQGYAILTLCRALYAWRSGDQLSKRQAAAWAMAELPEWAGLIQDALRWRQDYKHKDVDPTLTYPATVAFVQHVIDLIAR